jgi:viroplasmin and RNaseH domain-containing protein
MNKEFVIYEQALALKELGFDEDCFKVKLKDKPQLDYTPSDYDDFPEQKEVEVGIPLYQQAFRWFREKYRLYPIIDSFVGVKGVVKFFYKLPMYDETFNTYEEAEQACLDKLIEICKNK